ncbi:MAG TPA: alkaline phosphatase family protein [Candidatus Sulfotelmatobacter sp.]|nr:alkaline phosphatase family protein [Candidatus Sulfotelmatobacter sp.]
MISNILQSRSTILPLICLAVLSAGAFARPAGTSPQDATTPSTTYTLIITIAGTGAGTVVSTPAGISCKPTCQASFAAGTSVVVTASASKGSYFQGWTGACKGSAGKCTVTMNSNLSATATFNINKTVSVLNHIIFLAQENRSLDHYLGELRQYWKNNRFSDQSFDGLPQFNPTSGIAPLYGPPPTNPGCDPAYPPPADCTEDSASPNVTSYHLITQCIENPSPSWNESHQDWNLTEPISTTPLLNGYVYTGAHDARNNNPAFYDTNGIRVMGYYEDTDLNYYYYMASQFATSDRWFSPVMTRTQPNRDYLLAATSQGYVYPIGTDSGDQNLLTATTIFQELQNAGISWKIYVNPASSSCASNPTPQCLLTISYIQNFEWGQTIPQNYPNNLVPISQYFTDVQNGTLPQVAMIEPAYNAGLDEHGSDSDQYPVDIQLGAQYVESLINPLMTSVSWKDSAFILTYDEAGGIYDHVPAQPAVSPDGIKPVDLEPSDICTGNTGPNCDFVYTGYRVPLIVISPYSKKHYVNHNVADYTAILKLIETRFNLAALTKRDAAQINMTQFFNFNFPPWMTPPNPPAQSTSGPCYLNTLP